MRQITAIKLADTELYMKVLMSFLKQQIPHLCPYKEDIMVTNGDNTVNAKEIFDRLLEDGRVKENKLIYFDSVVITMYTKLDGNKRGQLGAITISSTGEVVGDVNYEDPDEADGIKVLTNAFVQEVKENSTEVETDIL